MALIVEKNHNPRAIFTLEKLRKQCRFDDSECENEEDDLLLDYLDACVVDAENYINSDITEKKYRITGKSFDDVLSFSMQIIKSVDLFEYKDANGETKTVDSNNFYFDTVDRFETKILFKENFTLPIVKEYSSTAVTLELTTGYASNKIPRAIKQALLLMVTYQYEFRNDTIKEKSTKAESLLHPYKRY